ALGIPENRARRRAAARYGTRAYPGGDTSGGQPARRSAVAAPPRPRGRARRLASPAERLRPDRTLGPSRRRTDPAFALLAQGRSKRIVDWPLAGDDAGSRDAAVVGAGTHWQGVRRGRNGRGLPRLDRALSCGPAPSVRLAARSRTASAY